MSYALFYDKISMKYIVNNKVVFTTLLGQTKIDKIKSLFFQ